MEESKFHKLALLGLLIAGIVVFFIISSGQNNQLNNEVLVQETSAVAPSDLDAEAEPSVKTKNTPSQPISDTTKELAKGFSYNKANLEANWNSELGCFNLPEDDEMRCEYPELSASSYEEALWMFENGYPPASVLQELEALGDEELKDLSLKNRKSWLPSLVLAQRYAESGYRQKAEKSFGIGEYRGLNPYGLLRRGMSLIQYADPNAPGWAYRTAAVQFKKAALLGDYAGKRLFYELINSYWNANPGLAVTTDIIETAHWELSRYYDLPRHQWPVQPRPPGG